MDNKELGEILASETIRVTQMEMELSKTNEIQGKYWAFFHLGFVACLRLNGKSEEDCKVIVDIAQENLKELM